MRVMVCHCVGLVVRPSTKETFAISAIGNGRVYLAKQSNLASAYNGFLRMQQVVLFLLPPGWVSSPLQGYSRHCILHTLGWRDKL